MSRIKKILAGSSIVFTFFLPISVFASIDPTLAPESGPFYIGVPGSGLDFSFACIYNDDGIHYDTFNTQSQNVYDLSAASSFFQPSGIVTVINAVTENGLCNDGTILGKQKFLFNDFGLTIYKIVPKDFAGGFVYFLGSNLATMIGYLMILLASLIGLWYLYNSMMEKTMFRGTDEFGRRRYWNE